MEISIIERSKKSNEIESIYNFDNGESLSKYAIQNGGAVAPLIIDSRLTNGTGLMNPSIFNYNGKLVVNIRHVNYTFYHSEKKAFQHQWGPLTYLHPENDMYLRTTNYLGVLTEDLTITDIHPVDSAAYDTYDPCWDFVGLEDARIIVWDDIMYQTGVRRDTTTNGQGRMELSSIEFQDGLPVETSRFRINPPNDMNSYCEKNWMPVVSRPYHYIKWCNPTELVRVDPQDMTTSHTVSLSSVFSSPNDFRGGSQVLDYEDGYFAIVHEVDLFVSTVGRKDAVYRHRFVVWDKDFNVVSYTRDFSLMNGHVEFAVGMCHIGDSYLITFGFQDNGAFVLRIPATALKDFIKDTTIYEQN